jgi:hypothetical protein
LRVEGIGLRVQTFFLSAPLAFAAEGAFGFALV